MSTHLFTLGAVSAGLGHNIFVQHLDGALKAGKLHHSVGDLSAPQGDDALVETETRITP